MIPPVRLSLTAACAILLTACSPADPAIDARVIILGFDGVDPGIVQTMIDAGDLPNLAQLAQTGTFAKLESSNPPQSPTAWSSFTTCKHPGEHGVFDFLRRNPQNYIAGLGFGSVVPPILGPNGELTRPPAFQTVRQGQSFWQVANEQGARVKILSVPFAFPAEDLQESCMLSGLGVPDIRGTNSTFFLLSTALAEPEGLSGGRALPLKFEDGEATVHVEGLRNPRTNDFVTVPLTVQRQGQSLAVTIPGQSVLLAEGEWSPWLEWTFPLTAHYVVRAASRIHVLENGEHVRLYMTCLQFHPDDPWIPFTSPPNYAAELAKRYGIYKTIGWIYDTHALRQGALTEDLFLQDVENTMAWRERLTLDELARGNFHLLVSAWTAPDRVSHMFWHHRDTLHPLHTKEGAAKYGNAVEDTYRKMDAIVGNVMEKLHENDLLMIMSDHGFHSFRRGFNVNTWLIRNGYLAVQGQTDPAHAHNEQDFLRGYDWSQTKAYSLGLGSIFLNLQGREGQGIVPPGQADALIDEIRQKLLQVTDPLTGQNVFRAVYTRHEYQGTAQEGAPDLQLGYAEGYQSTKDAAKGSAPPELFEDNTDTWSGEHAASDIAFTQGIFFSNIPINTQTPNLVDLGVTALHYLGKQPPPDFQGKPLL